VLRGLDFSDQDWLGISRKGFLPVSPRSTGAMCEAIAVDATTSRAVREVVGNIEAGGAVADETDGAADVDRRNRRLPFELALSAVAVLAELVWEALRSDAFVPAYLWSAPGDIIRLLLDVRAAQWFPVVVAVPMALAILFFGRQPSNIRPSFRGEFSAIAIASVVALFSVVSLEGDPGTTLTRFLPLASLTGLAFVLRATDELGARRAAGRAGSSSSASATDTSDSLRACFSLTFLFAIGWAILASLIVGGFLRDLATVEQSDKSAGYAGLTLRQASGVGSDDADYPEITGAALTGPSAYAGFQPGDLIISVSGTTVATPADVVRVVAAHRPGFKADFLVYRRGGSQIDITVTLSDRFDALRLANAH
jgi:hypothetical protein